jgi:hypothetical protein
MVIVMPCILLFLPLILAAAGQRAVVVPETAPVYTHPRPSPDEMLRSFRRGDVVTLDIAISSSEGEWCAVSTPNGSDFLGYMRCDTLKREEPPPPAVEAATRDRSAPEAPAVYMAPVRHWEERFEFSPAQQAHVDGLARKTGVSTCLEQMGDLQDRTERFAYRCMEKRVRLLEHFPGILTPAQKAKAQLVSAFNRELADLRRELR